MEVTAAERTTIYTNISPLAQRVNNYIQTQHSSIAAVAKDIGYSRTTVSRYLTGKYDSNPNDLESKLTDFLTRQTGEAVDLTTPLAKSEGKTWQTPVFFESRDAKAVLGVCQSCQEYIGLGIVVARSGYGKTYALRQYAKLSRVAYIECDDTMSSRDLVEAIERSIGLPNGYGTIWRRVNGIREFFNTNKGYLLIIDEADKLVSKYTQKKMEILRAVFDQSDVGLVIAGEPKLEAQIKTYLVRMANRVDFYASLRGLSPSEVEGYLTDFQIEPEALVELKARACNMQTGCFRLLDRTLSNVRRILKETGEETVTVKTILQAEGRSLLQDGTALHHRLLRQRGRTHEDRRAEEGQVLQAQQQGSAGRQEPHRRRRHDDRRRRVSGRRRTRLRTTFLRITRRKSHYGKHQQPDPRPQQRGTAQGQVRRQALPRRHHRPCG